MPLRIKSLVGLGLKCGENPYEKAAPFEAARLNMIGSCLLGLPLHVMIWSHAKSR